MIYIKKCNAVLWVMVLAVQLFLAPSVEGGELSPRDNAVNSLGLYHASGKIGGANDESKFAKAIWEHLDVKNNGTSQEADIVDKSQTILELLWSEANRIWPDIPGGSVENQIKSAVSHLAGILKSNTPNEWTPGDIARAADGLAREAQNLDINIDKWNIDSDDLIWKPIAEVNVNFKTEFLESNCESPVSQKCKKSFKEAVDALRIADLTYRTVALLKTTKINDAHFFFAKRVKQREEYRDGFPQWPWEELLVNGPIYQKKTKDILGSPPPPTSQLIVLHPDIAMEYMPDAKDGDQFKPSFMVELLGINYWEWEKDGSMGGPFFGFPIGAGLITTFTDREGQSDWGWGGIVHINHIFNIGVTFRDGNPSYLVSVNLAELFNSKDTVENVLGK